MLFAAFSYQTLEQKKMKAHNKSKELPAAVDMEKAVLGALIMDKEAFPRVASILTAEMFYIDSHQTIFKAILDLFIQNSPIDLLTVKNQLRNNGYKLGKGQGGVTYLADLVSVVASAANIEVHARIIAQMAILRQVAKVSAEVYHKVYETGADAFELLNQAEQGFFEISTGQLRKNYETTGDLFLQALQELEEMKGKGSSVTGIKSGFEEVDRITAGFQKSDLIILAARPAMGKTALTLNIARNAASHGEPVAFFSLEMSSSQLMRRLIAAESEIDGQQMRRGDLHEMEFGKIMKKGAYLSDLPLYIDDTPGLSIWELKTKCRRLKAEKGISLVIIDYLQLMTASSQKGWTREREIAHISRSLKEIAKELNVCIIALSQLSRAVESRGGDKRPMLSDLRESGSIEQDADAVFFLYRGQYYGFETDEEGNSTHGLAELILAKQRNGPTGNIKLQFIQQYGKFTAWEFETTYQ